MSSNRVVPVLGANNAEPTTNDAETEMHRLGIATKAEYDAFKASPDYEECKRLGFTTKAFHLSKSAAAD